VTGEYSAALSGQNWIIHRRCQSGAVASGIFSRMTSATDKAFMQDASTRIVMFEMCGNDFLQARSNFKSSTGTCNYSGLDTAASNCRSFTQQAMDFINTTANANTKLKIVMNLHYPGYDADNALSGCTDATTGQKVNMQDLFLPRLLESDWNTCNFAAQKGFICSDAFAEFMARDYDSNSDGKIDSDAIRYIQGESLANYKARVIALKSTLRDSKFHMVNSTTTFNYLQSDDTHPSFEGATASTNLGLTTPGGNVTVLFTTAGAYPDGKNPHWNQNGHDRSGWGLNPGGSLTPEKCGNGISNETSWLPSGTAVVEGCDDGNTTNGDGCSSSCTVETGWACSGSPSMCAPVCGDGLVTGAEQCDDSNTTAGDGCSATCTVEPGFSCMGHPSTCSAICGDGLVVNGEGCDDGNLANGDGCSSTCVVETGWHCSGETSVCAPICGDSLIVGTEDCDDGDKNGTMQSCCSTSCAFEEHGTSCDDGNACNVDEVCDGTSNQCGGGSPANCDDNNPCTDDTCDPSTGCAHSNNTASCDDGNACTTNDTCGGGTCHAGAPLVCNDNNGCTNDSCNPTSGCVYTNNTDPCNDGNACTTNDTCADGSCHGGDPLTCNDGNGCTDDSCNPSSGCVFTNNTNPCDDGNACTLDDTCGGGTCNGGPPPDCDDGNVCTTDTCNPAIGCVNTNNTAPCSDGDACTAPDVCGGGTCHSGSAVYGFTGFLQPVDNLPIVNLGKAGRTYPVKWQLPLCSGGYVSRLNAVLYNPLRIRQVNCDTNASLDTLETETPGSSGLTYDVTSNEYHYNWQTSSTYLNRCYDLLLELDNGTTQVARFKFTK
jgi:cysteine-rich repeat protein